MRYQDGAAFRRALEDRLNRQARLTGEPLSRSRKLIAFERLLARLAASQPEAWLLKGGLALQWRYAGLARTTQDLDVLLLISVDDVHAELVSAAQLDMGDWFTYTVQRPPRSDHREAGTQRLSVTARLDSRPFENFHLDVGWGDPVVEPADQIASPSLLGFAGIEPVVFPCYPLSQHLAEKVHAQTLPHVTGVSTRVKDLVDIVLISGQSGLRADRIAAALAATFEARQTHPLPSSLPNPPQSWGLTYQRMAAELGLDDTDVQIAVKRARRFLDPVLQHRARGLWDAQSGSWEDASPAMGSSSA